MCDINEKGILMVMKVAKSIYKLNEDNHKIKRISLLLSTILIFIYVRKKALTIDLYALIPYSVSSQINILNNLVDLGYICRYAKKEDKSTVYGITALGKEVIENYGVLGINKNYKPNKYKPKATRNRLYL